VCAGGLARGVRRSGARPDRAAQRERRDPAEARTLAGNYQLSAGTRAALPWQSGVDPVRLHKVRAAAVPYALPPPGCSAFCRRRSMVPPAFAAQCLFYLLAMRVPEKHEAGTTRDPARPPVAGPRAPGARGINGAGQNARQGHLAALLTRQ
jgi:hypothetical protein